MQSRIKHLTFWGYVAGVVTGITYGLNPLFAMPLITGGMAVDAVLFFRYFIAAILLGTIMCCHKATFRVDRKQFVWLVVLGLLFSFSSLCLFEAYKYVPSGIATTLVFLYPILVAIIMVVLRVYPTWQVWISIAITFVGVVCLCQPHSAQSLQWQGLVLAFMSALLYAVFIVIVNRNTAISSVSNSLLTFFVLCTGTVVFSVHMLAQHTSLIAEGVKLVILPWAWLNILCLAIFPTIISTATLAVATKYIGATKASVMGVFEPVTAVVVGTIVFGEPINASIVVGVVLVSVAIVFMILTEKKKQ